MPRRAQSSSSAMGSLYIPPRMDGIEDVGKYVPGGYHPVDIGDDIGTADGVHQYTVLHKLGHGGFSTVWLVRSSHNMLYFALKILCATPPGTECDELRALEHLRRTSGGRHPCIIELHGSFEITGPNGRHLRGIKCVDKLQVGWPFYMSEAFVTVYGHVDLTPSNIAFEFPDTSSLDSSQVCELLGPIKTEKLTLPDGTHSPHAPKRVVQAPNFSGFHIPEPLANVQIIDLGAAFFAERPPPSLGVPMSFFPPELCFGYSPSLKSDVWELGCLMFEVLSEMRLFRMYFPIYEILVGTAMPILGPLPLEWKECFNNERYGYRERGHLKSDVTPDWWFETELHTETLRSQLNSFAPHLSAAQREAVARILERMLVFEPEQRISSAEVELLLKPLSSLFEAELAGK